LICDTSHDVLLDSGVSRGSADQRTNRWRVRTAGYAGVSDGRVCSFRAITYNRTCETQRGAMNIERHSGFYVIGLAARTQNSAERNGKGKIGEIWRELLRDNLASKIPNKIGINLTAVYTDYERGLDNHYTYLLGLPVSSIQNVPAPFVAKHIPGGRYSVVTSDRGPIARIVPETWSQICSMPVVELGGIRSFRADYEIYDQRATDPEKAQIEVYVGLR
jgi:predicted transcriptional regulator YdeE